MSRSGEMAKINLAYYTSREAMARLIKVIVEMKRLQPCMKVLVPDGVHGHAILALCPYSGFHPGDFGLSHETNTLVLEIRGSAE